MFPTLSFAIKLCVLDYNKGKHYGHTLSSKSKNPRIRKSVKKIDKKNKTIAFHPSGGIFDALV